MLEAFAHRRLSASAQRREPVRPVTRSSSVPTVLCVDDHALVLSTLEHAFVRDGWRVTTAVDGEAALDYLRVERAGFVSDVDAVVADFKLPGITGLELIKTMWSEGIDAAPVIYTGFPDEATEREASSLGIAYLSKLDVPRTQELARLVRGVVHQHRARRLARVEEVARLFVTIAARLAAGRTPSVGWWAEVAAPLVRILADPTTAFAVFLTTAEALRFVCASTENPRTAGTFLRLQAERCLRRSEMALSIRLDQIAGSLARRGQLWKLAHLGVSLRAAAMGGKVDQVLRMMGWSQARILQGVTLRRAVILVADTNGQTAQIAYQLGVDHPASFNRFFKNLLGLSPRDLRDLIRSG